MAALSGVAATRQAAAMAIPPRREMKSGLAVEDEKLSDIDIPLMPHSGAVEMAGWASPHLQEASPARQVDDTGWENPHRPIA